MFDEAGYRYNVGIILINARQQVFWAKRLQQDGAWQFPQGGMQAGETPEEAMYRELTEEVGLLPSQVSLLASTQDWLFYDLPPEYRRYFNRPLCVGQKQKWFLLKFLDKDEVIKLDYSSEPEFCEWRWVDYWFPLKEVVSFKKAVYEQALKALEPYLDNQ